jgi:hypothetical protein
MMLDHIKPGAVILTTYLTTNRNELRDNNGIYRTKYHLFRTKKHYLDAISRKKLSPFAWGDRDHKFKYFFELSTATQNILERVSSVLICFQISLTKPPKKNFK